MSKTAVCPVAYWPGSVTLITPAPYPVVREWRKSVRAGQAYLAECLEREEKKLGRPLTENETYDYEPFELDACYIPGFMAFVEKWELGGDFPKSVTAATFPAQPPGPAHELAQWLIREINATFAESEAAPNA